MASRLDESFRPLLDKLAVGTELTLGTSRVRVVNNNNGYKGFVEVKGSALYYSDKLGTRIGYTPLHDFANELRRIEAQLAQDAAEAVKAALDDLTKTQYASLSQLRKAGHPYAIGGRGGLPAPAFHINKQSTHSGEVMSESFTVGVSTPSDVGGVYGLWVRNPTYQAGALATGTSRMIARPYDAQAVLMAQKALHQKVETAANEIAKLGAGQAIINQIRQMPVEFDLGSKIEYHSQKMINEGRDPEVFKSQITPSYIF